jgi:hypothetical protein
MLEKRVESVWWTLRVVFVVVPIVAGVDKFVGLLADWPSYLSPLARQLIPIDPDAFMKVVGAVEVAAGVLVLRDPRLGGYVVAVWLVAIALNLLSAGRWFDVAVRDVVMAVSAYCLARLSEAREKAPSRERTSASVGAPAPARA